MNLDFDLDLRRLYRILPDLFNDAISDHPSIALKACGEYALVELLMARHAPKAIEKNDFDWMAVADRVSGSDKEKVALECLRLEQPPPPELYREDAFEGLWLQKLPFTDYKWQTLSNRFLRKIMLDGLDGQDAYELTHIVFYWTDFGNDKPVAREYIIIVELLLQFIDAVSPQDYDLESEVYLELSCSNSIYGNELLEFKLKKFLNKINHQITLLGHVPAHREMSRDSRLYWYGSFHTTCLLVAINLLATNNRNKAQI